jgi:hypothetical protein
LLDQVGEESAAVTAIAEDIDQNGSIQQDNHAGRLLLRFTVVEALERMSLSLRSFLTHAALPDASSG